MSQMFYGCSFFLNLSERVRALQSQQIHKYKKVENTKVKVVIKHWKIEWLGEGYRDRLSGGGGEGDEMAWGMVTLGCG